MKKYALLLLFFVSGINYSQKPNLGIGIGLSFLKSNEYNFVLPIHFSLNLRQKIVDKTNIKFDIGFAFYAEEYGGLDLNLLLENEIYKKMKIIGGINSHHNGGIAHGTAFSTETYSKTFYNYIIGLGINFTEKINIGLLFLIPTEKEFGYTADNSTEGHIKTYKYLNYIIKLSIEFYL